MTVTMAARRCSLCGIDFPVGIQCCRVCGGDTSWMDTAVPDPDWQHAVAARLSLDGRLSEGDRVAMWRLASALRLGYPVEVAESLAASDADLHDLEKLIGVGCPHELAARIV